jgi:hypothetical protein
MADRVVADGVDAPEHHDQATGANAMVDRAVPYPEVGQLLSTYDAVLRTGQPRDRPVNVRRPADGGRLATLGIHSDVNVGTCEAGEEVPTLTRAPGHATSLDPRRAHHEHL